MSKFEKLAYSLYWENSSIAHNSVSKKCLRVTLNTYHIDRWLRPDVCVLKEAEVEEEQNLRIRPVVQTRLGTSMDLLRRFLRRVLSYIRSGRHDFDF